ncbi:MAG: class B sortase [Clostridiales bacterium]|nr:class B sortase [Clostridiales bacterium]
MKGKWIKALKIVLAAILVVGLAVVLYRQMEYANGAADYDEAAALAGVPKSLPSAAPAVTAAPGESPAPEPAEEPDPALALLAQVDLAALQEVNNDVRGWICIPDTELSYPLMQGTDNQYYLNHTWQGNRNGVGAIFLDYRASADFTDFYTLIYGHRMNNTSMFGSIAQYKNVEYWQAHPSVYIICEDGVKRYDIFSTFETDVYSDVYRRSLRTAEDREAFLAWCLEQSAIDTGVVPAADRNIITLSTCTNSNRDHRWVVLAALADSMEIT